MPTLDSRDAWKAQKLNPLLQETPVIRDLLGGQRSRDAANSKDMIDFPGGVLFLGGQGDRVDRRGRGVGITI